MIINHAIKNGVPNAVMAEVGFHSNAQDAEILVEKRVELAELEAELIAKHLKIGGQTRGEKRTRHRREMGG